MEDLARYIADSLSNSNQSCFFWYGTVPLHQRERKTLFSSLVLHDDKSLHRTCEYTDRPCMHPPS